MTRDLLRPFVTITAIGLIGGLVANTPPALAQKPPAAATKGAKPKSPSPAPTARIAVKPTLDVSLIPADAAVGVVTHPRRVLSAPEMKMMPLEVFTAAGLKEWGINPLDVEQLLAIGKAPSGPGDDPQVAFVVRFVKPPQPSTLVPKLMEQTEKGTLGGKIYRKARDPRGASIYLVDPQTLIVGSDPLLQAMVSGKNEPGHVAKLLQQVDLSNQVVAVVSIDAMRDLIKMGVAQLPPLPAPFDGFVRAPDHIAAIEFHWNMGGLLGGQIRSNLIFHGIGPAGAQEIETILITALAVGKQMMLARMEQQKPQGDDPVEQATVKYIDRVVDIIFNSVKPIRNEDRVSLSVEVDGNLATVGVMVGLLLPALQAARDAAERTSSINKLKMIGLAMHNRHDVSRAFPPRASLDKDGKPLLSWRVSILPFIDETQLYDQFHLDEPWDSEHNIKLVDKMPAIYAAPERKEKDGKTVYLMPVGKGTMFEGSEKVNMRTVTDGTSKTIMIVEADSDRAVVWTAPEDLPVNADEPARGLGHLRPNGGFAALFVDGHVALLNDIAPELLMALFTSKGGEQIPPGNY